MKTAIVSALLAVVAVVITPDAEELRKRGQASVNELHQSSQDDALLDQVCAQKDCRASRLFWYTDLEEAKAAAHVSGKPILSLHLLGRLDEELSCANSRFFRTLLYPDPSINSLMRDEFVLHWVTVRPVPRITIDMGDGRTIKQTITGNSAHFLLDENGKPLDVSPGLHSPKAFREQLERWMALYRTHLDENALRAYHQQRMSSMIELRNEVGVSWEYDDGKPPTAEEAARRAMTKSMPELPILRRLRDDESLGTMLQSAWLEIGRARKDEVQFSEEALALMGRKQKITEPLLDALRSTVAQDTVFNEGELHFRIHAWFVYGEVGDVASLNKRIYDELFLTPEDDPWMGLQQPSAFTAIGE